MVKEFELVNISTNIPNDTELVGTLSDDGDTLNIVVGDRSSVSSYKYQLSVVYANINHEYKTVEYETLYTGDLVDTIEDVSIDISGVRDLITPATVSIKSSTITVDIFTQEANVDTTYGSKRISFPNSTTLEDVSFSYSTDGIYVISLFQISEYSSSNSYSPGDVCYSSSTAYVNLVATNGSPTSETDSWEELDEEGLTSLAVAPDRNNEFYNVSYNVCINTRSIKQEILIPLALSTSFQKYDDLAALNKLEYYTNMREAVVCLVRNNDYVKADYTRLQLMQEFNAGKVGKSPEGDSETYTNYTL